MTTVAISSQGTKVYIGSTGSPNDYTAIPGIVSMSAPSSEVPEIDASDLDSTSKEFIAGLKDNGEMTLKMNFNTDNAVHRAIRAAFVANPSTTKQWVIEWPDTAPLTRWEFQGYVKSFKPTAGVDEKLSIDVTVRVTGDITQYN